MPRLPKEQARPKPNARVNHNVRAQSCEVLSCLNSDQAQTGFGGSSAGVVPTLSNSFLEWVVTQ